MSPRSAEVLNRKTGSDEANRCCGGGVGAGSAGQGPPGCSAPTLCLTDLESPSDFGASTNAPLLPGLRMDTGPTPPCSLTAWSNGARRGAKETQTLHTQRGAL